MEGVREGDEVVFVALSIQLRGKSLAKAIGAHRGLIWFPCQVGVRIQFARYRSCCSRQTLAPLELR